MNYLHKSTSRGELCLVLLFLMTFFAPLNANAQQTTITYHNGTVTSSNLPFNSGWAYSFTEQLYSASDLGIAGDITSISFYLGQSYNAAQTNTVTVYMKNVSRSSLSITDYEAVTSADIVYSGSWTIPANYTGWVAINLDAPFAYDGSNLMVAIHESTSGYEGRYFYYTNMSNASAVQWRDDTYDPNPYDLESYQGGNNTLYLNSDIQIVLTPSPTPKPKMLTVGNVAARVATLSWTAPNEDVLNYQYQYKDAEGEWMALETTDALSVNLNGLNPETEYSFQVKAVYAAGESNFATTTFTTNSSCEQPTDLTADAVGDLTYATLTWKENGEANSWVLQYASDYYFSDVIEVTTGFVVDGNIVSCTLTGLSEQTYFARVKPACDTEDALWSDIINFTPSFATLAVGGTSTSSNTVPIYGYYVSSNVFSQFIIPAESLDALAGGMLKRFTFHHNSWTFNLNGAQFEVYVAELDNATFSSNQFVDWTTLTQVFSGSLSTEANKMIVTLDNEFMYQGGNLLIGFKQTVSGNGSNVSWYGSYGTGSGYRSLYSYSSSSVYGTSFMPKLTFGYLPTSYPRVAAIEEGAITSTTATLSWAAPSNNVTGYVYQVKRLSDAEWPAQWTSLNTTTVTLSGLSQATDYRFRVKVLYGEHESVPFNVGFTTECGEFADVPFFENFDSSAEGEMPRCWNRIADNGFPAIYESSTYAHSGTKSLQLWKYNGTSYPDQYAILPQMQNIRDLRVSFYARRAYSSTASCVIVGVMTDPTDVSTFQEIATCDSEGASYQKIKVSLASYTGSNGYIAFKTATTPCYFYIDDVTVEAIPDCEEPDALEVDNVEAHAATFGWTDSGNPNVWQIYVSTDNVMPAEPIAANLHNVNSNPATISGLAPVTEYYAWVRSNCGSSGYSPWSDPINFTTAIACPQLIDFEYPEMSDIAATYALLRWHSDGQETAWQICLNDDEDHLIDANNNTFTITGLTPATEYSVKVRANCGGEDGYSEWSEERWFKTDLCDPEDKCNISYTTNSNEWYGEIVFMSDDTEVAVLSLYEGSNDFALCPGVYDIVWRSYGYGSFAIYGSDGNELYSTDQAEDLSWDEVLVSSYNHVCEGVCFPPRNLDVLATTTTATFTWEPVGEETEWKVQYDALYTTNTIDFDGMTELPDSWYIYTDVEEDNVELGLDNDNACLHLSSVNSAYVSIPVSLGGISSFDVKAVGEATTVSYEINGSDYYFEDQKEIGTSEYQTIMVPSQGYSGRGWLGFWINGGEVFIDNVQFMDQNGGYSNAETTVQGIPSYVIEGLAPGTDYKARVKAVCGQDDESGWKETTFTTPLCDDACRIRYFLGDAASDGWNGAYISVLNSSATQVARLTFDDGDELSGYLSLCPDEIYSFIWISGGYDNECFFTIYGSDWTTMIATHEEYSDFPENGVLCGSYEHHCAPCEIFEVSYGNPYEEDFNNTCWNTWTTIEGEEGNGHGDYGYTRLWQVNDDVIHVVPGRYTSSYFCLPPVKVTATTQLSFRTWIETWPDMYTGDSYVIVSTDNGHTWHQISRGFEGGESYPINDLVVRTMRTRTVSLGAYAEYPSILVGIRYQGHYDQNGGGISEMFVDRIRIYDPNVFTDGAKNASWSNAANWTQGIPTESDWVLINGNCDMDVDATVTSAIVGSDKTLTIQGGNTLTTDQMTTTEASQLVINDGGQLKHNNEGLLVTLEKEIEHYTVVATQGNIKANGWYLVSFPVEVWNDTYGIYEGIHPSQVTNLMSNTYDLYRFDSYYVDEEWRNYKDPDNSDMFMSGLPTDGFLYANSGDNGQDVTLQFAGKVSSVQSESNRVYLFDNEDNEAFGTWNLVGNPLLCEAYPLYGEEVEGGEKFNDKSLSSDWVDYGTMPYYRMNGDRTDLMIGEGAIQPLEGVFMQYAEDRSIVHFSSEPFEEQGGMTADAKGGIILNLTGDHSSVIDRAEVRFGNGPMLAKLMLNSNNTNICIPQGGRKFSIVNRANEGEVPVNFKAAQNGVFTLNTKVNEAEMAYIHLIDNLTGADVDLLETPTYTFSAKSTDYESRFKLVFATIGEADGDDDFAFFSNGNWVVVNEGEAVVQVIDMNGRILSSETINGSAQVNVNAACGLYVMRLVSGEKVKTQKIVVQ